MHIEQPPGEFVVRPGLEEVVRLVVGSSSSVCGSVSGISVVVISVVMVSASASVVSVVVSGTSVVVVSSGTGVVVVSSCRGNNVEVVRKTGRFVVVGGTATQNGHPQYCHGHRS